MPDETKARLVLERHDPSRNMARFYALSIEPSLFGDIALVREWGRIGRCGQRRIELYESRESADAALGLWQRRKQRRGYVAQNR